MGLVNFGTFQIDLAERRIYTIAGELPVEPKVVDVLCYLIQNSDRFVSLQELHAEVWTGRVVTDTAVRRTISKLRAVLGDTDQDAPLFIKSQMKRGYQCIGLPVPADTSEAELISPVAADGSVKLSNVETSVTARPKPARFWYGIFSVILMVLVLFSFLFMQRTPDKAVITTDPLVNIAGEKIFLSVSDNGRFQAFTGRLNKTDGWQPYIFDSQLGHLQKINRPQGATSPFVSVVNNDTVVVSTVENGQANLHLYSIANLEKPVKIIQLKEFLLIGQAVSYQDKVILINGQKKDEKNCVYYLLDLDDETTKQFTFNPRQNSIDLNVVFSPDKKYFALIRSDSIHQVQVYRTVDKVLLLEELFEVRKVSVDELNLVWIDNNRLLINYGDKSKQLNISTKTKLELPMSERFSGLGRDNAGNLFGLLKQPQKKIFYQAQLGELGSIQRYYSFTGQAVSLSYSQTPEKLWLVEQDGNSHQLHHYHPDTGDKKFYLKSNEPFSVVGEDHNATYLLLWFNYKQLKMLNQKNGKLTDISDVSQKIGFATFATDDSVIFFAEKIGDLWQVNAFDRKTLTQSRILKGYRLLLPWKQQFIVADVKGQFYLLDQHYQLVNQLQLQIDFNLRHQVSLHGNKLIAANIGVDSNWRLATLNLISGQYHQQVTNTLPIKTQFSFNKDGSAAVVVTGNDHENQLVKIGYNFGYD